MRRLIRVRVPDIHDRATGGSVVNRRLIAALRRRSDVRVRVDRPDGGEAPSANESDALDSGNEYLTLVDALRIEDPGPGRNVLLAHYLHCVDPEAEASEEAERGAAIELPDGLRVRRSWNYTFVFNYAAEAVEIPAAIAGAPMIGSRILESAGFAVFATR